LCCPFTLSSCDLAGIVSPASSSVKATTTNTYEVTLVYNNGDENGTLTVEEGKTFATPSDPDKENYIFEGWYSDVKLSKKYDFSKAVTKDLTLYAKYILDAADITNKISQDTMKSLVKVYNENYNMTIFGSEKFQGSGFCFHIQGEYYYVITNCHVVADDPSYSKQSFTIEDYQGNVYTAHLYKNPNKQDSAISPEYDLACLWFKATSTNVKELSIVSENPEVGEDVISLGAPKDQSNSITYGQISEYRKITLEDTSEDLSNVTFEVIHHDALINNGSSGGPILNADLNVVGVNYAGASQTGEGYAIPAEKLIEFLNTYVYD
ncbi:MAG: trypsin-like peptidase domain-containing protein, partial [Eubacteriales bacterium]